MHNLGTMAENYTLHFFNVRGTHGEAIRYIFAYAGVEYNDHRIEVTDWPSQKQKYQWGQLPALQVGDKYLYQSIAICRYLGKKFGLCGDTEWENAKLDEYMGALTDFQTQWTKHLLVKDDEVKKAEVKKIFRENALPKYYQQFEDILKKNGPYVLGSKITWFDIVLTAFIDHHDVCDPPPVLESYPSLKALREKVLALPQIKAWIDRRPVTAT